MKIFTITLSEKNVATNINGDFDFQQLCKELTQGIHGNLSSLNNLYNNPLNKCKINVSLSAPISVIKREGKSLTYLNQNQQYELSLQVGDSLIAGERHFLTTVKIGFEDRRMQIKRKEKFVEWFNEHSDHELFDIIPTQASNIFNVQRDANHRGKIQFEWKSTYNATPLIKVYCLSSDFCENKSGGEEGIVLSLKISTFDKTFNNIAFGFIPNLIHKCSCGIKVFKMKGADRKYKQELAKYQKEIELFNQQCGDFKKQSIELKYKNQQYQGLMKEKEHQLKKKMAEYSIKIGQKEKELYQHKSQLTHMLTLKKSELELELCQKRSQIDLQIDNEEIELEREKQLVEKEKSQLELEIKTSSTQMDLLDNQINQLLEEFNSQYNVPKKHTAFETTNKSSQTCTDVMNSPDSLLNIPTFDSDINMPNKCLITPALPYKRKQEAEVMATPPKIAKDLNICLTRSSSTDDVSFWLESNGFSHLKDNFNGYSGEDMLGLEREDVLQLCEAKDGIRLFNKLKILKNPVLRELFIAFKWFNTSAIFELEFTSIILTDLSVDSFKDELQKKGQLYNKYISEIYITKLNNISYAITDDNISQIKNQQPFIAELMINPNYPDQLNIVLREAYQN